VAFAGKDHDTREAELQIASRLKVDLLRVHPGRVGIAMTLQVAKYPLVAKRPEDPG
jgi:hypothetical protein